MSFDYQKSSSTIPYSTYGNTTNEQGSVHMFYNGGGNNAYAVLYFNQVSIGSNISGCDFQFVTHKVLMIHGQ